jgi:hypothetical protein
MTVPRWIVLLMAPLWIAAAAGTTRAGYEIEVLQRIPLGVLPATGLYRSACCPDGSCAILHNSGSVIVVDGEGTIRFNQTNVPEFTEATACACDAANRLWVGAAGLIKSFELTPAGKPRLIQTFQASGAIHRILVTGDQIYVLGQARAAGADVLLRRFRKADGTFLGAVPLEAGRRPWSSFTELGDLRAQLLVNGSLVPFGDGLLYIPANPLELRRYGSQGQPVDTQRPLVRRFRSVDLDHFSSSNGPGVLAELDWVMNALPLPDGKILVQMLTRVPSSSPEAATEPEVYLALFDSNLELLTEDIRLDPATLPGSLAGIDRAGQLCFTEIVSGGTSWLLKARLRQR